MYLPTDSFTPGTIPRAQSGSIKLAECSVGIGEMQEMLTSPGGEKPMPPPSSCRALKPLPLCFYGAAAHSLESHTEERRPPACSHSWMRQRDISGSSVGAPHSIVHQGPTGAQWSHRLLGPPESLCVHSTPWLSVYSVILKTLERKHMPKRKKNGDG